MESLNTILEFTKDDKQKKEVERHKKMVLEAGKSSLINSQDYSDLENRYKTIPFLRKL